MFCCLVGKEYSHVAKCKNEESVKLMGNLHIAIATDAATDLFHRAWTGNSVRQS